MTASPDGIVAPRKHGENLIVEKGNLFCPVHTPFIAMNVNIASDAMTTIIKIHQRCSQCITARMQS